MQKKLMQFMGYVMNEWLEYLSVARVGGAPRMDSLYSAVPKSAKS